MKQPAHRLLGEILVARGSIDDEALAHALAEQSGVEFVDARAVRVQDSAIDLLDFDAAVELECLPVAVEDGHLALVVADPYRDDRPTLERLAGCPVQFLVGTPTAIRRAIEANYTSRQSRTLPSEGIPAPGPDETGPQPALEMETDEASGPSTEELWAVEPADDGEPDGAHAADAPADVAMEPAVVLDLPEAGLGSLAELTSGLRPDSGPEAGRPLVLGLAAGALDWKADALRLEWSEGALAVSYFLDGVWRGLVKLPNWAGGVVSATLREMLDRPADAPLAELDGARIEGHRAAGHAVQFVLSTASRQGGERVTLQVRDPARLVRLEQFGMSVDSARRLRQWSAARQGLLLVVGTHGSGRTNLIRGIAEQVAAYRTVAQVLADPLGSPAGRWTERGVTDEEGAAAVQAALELDPKVLAVDDCDGPRTAALTFRAALQDRLVVAALRGRDAAEALQRLRDDGLDDLLVGDHLLGVIETRLVRLLCRSCWVRGPLDTMLAARLGLVTDTMPNEVPKAGAGCPACHHTGYHGRRALVSRVELDGGVQDGSSPEELRQAVTMNRPRTVAEAGLGLVVQGLTSIEELARVVAPRPQGARLAPDVEATPAIKAPPTAEAPPAVGAPPAVEAPSAAAAVEAPTDTSEGSEEGTAAEPAAASGPVVSVASPSWTGDGPEETEADVPAPTVDGDGDSDDLDTVDLGELVGFDEEAAADESEDDRHLVVVIDPREELQAELAAALPPDEFRVVGMGNLDDAVMFVKSELPTAVALTAGWHFDAAGALRALRNDLASAFLPLLVVAEDDDSNVELLRAGADEVLPSSVPAEELELRLRAVIRRVT